MSKRTIAVDIDDTLAQSLDAFRQRVNEQANANLTAEDYKIEADYWGYYEKVWDTHGLSNPFTSADIFGELHTNHDLVPLLPGAEFAVHELMKRFDVVLITARDLKWQEATKEWLQLQFGDKMPDVYFSGGHHNEGSKNKGQICVELGADWLIDDNVEHCLAAISEGVTPILFGDYGWQFTAPKELVRCGDWQTVLDYFDGRDK